MQLDELNKKPLTDLKNWIDVDDASATDILGFFNKHGFDYVGQGSFGLVMEHPNLDYVIKIFDARGDIGYIEFVRFALRYPYKTHLPRFIGKPKQIDGRWYVIRMETLKPISYELSIEVGKLWRKTRDIYNSSSINLPEDTIESLSDLFGAMSEIMNEKKIHADVRQDNIMMRPNGDIVITDPWIK